jgi:hypothetical protein
VEELGVEPSAAVARLETAILRHDEELEWRPVGPPLPAMSARRRPEPVSGAAVTEPHEATCVPLPHFLTEVGRIFVGRDDEVARLEQLGRKPPPASGECPSWPVSRAWARPGLAAELAGRAHEEGAVVLAGRCDEDLGVPYQPFVEALRHFADHTPSEDLRPRLGRYGAELVRLVPELAERVRDLARSAEAVGDGTGRARAR